MFGGILRTPSQKPSRWTDACLSIQVKLQNVKEFCRVSSSSPYYAKKTKNYATRLTDMTKLTIPFFYKLSLSK